MSRSQTRSRGRRIGPASRREPAYALAIVVIVLAATTGCFGGATGDVPGKLDVVASTDVWGSVVRAVGGSQVSVVSIISDPDQDPHSFEASSRTLLTVKNADLLVENGGGYDDFMGRMISATGSTASMIDAVQVSGQQAPPGGELNEHVWYDLQTAQKVAGVVASRLAVLAPRHAAEFRANAAVFARGVDRLIGREDAVRRLRAGAGVAITEPVPLYLLGAMGLRNLTPPAFSDAIEGGGEVSPRVLAQMLDLFAGGQVSALVYNAQTSGPVTERVEAAATAAGVAVVPVTETLPARASYLSWMARNVHAVAAAVGAP